MALKSPLTLSKSIKFHSPFIGNYCRKLFEMKGRRGEATRMSTNGIRKLISICVFFVWLLNFYSSAMNLFFWMEIWNAWLGVNWMFFISVYYASPRGILIRRSFHPSVDSSFLQMTDYFWQQPWLMEMKFNEH